MSNTNRKQQRVHGIATTQSALLVAAVAAPSILLFHALGDSSQRAVTGESIASVAANRAATLGIGRTDAQTPQRGEDTSLVGSRSAAALGVAQLIRVTDAIRTRGTRRVHDAIVDATPPGEEPVRIVGVNMVDMAERVEDAVRNGDAPGLGRPLVAHRFTQEPSKTWASPAPENFASTMEAFMASAASGRATTELRQAYDHALTSGIRRYLFEMQEEYGKAFDYTKTDRTQWQGLFDHALLLRRDLQARDALSAEDIFRLADALESAKYGYEVQVPRAFTPVFAEGRHYEDPADLVDAFIKGRELYREYGKVYFPHFVRFSDGDVVPPTQHLRNPAQSLPEALTEAAEKSLNVAVTYENIERPKVFFRRPTIVDFSPVDLELPKRAALINGTFPGSRLYETYPNDARRIIEEFYELIARNPSGTSPHWRSNPVDQLRFRLDWAEQKEAVEELISTANALRNQL